MDFNSLLAKANSNTKKVSSKLSELDSEVVKEEKAKLRRLEAEKRARLELAKRRKDARPKREPTPEKKFTIPKKKDDAAPVDKSKILAYMAKQEQEKREIEKKKQAEKERLIQLRLQTFGGKANKKLGKHFGMNPIDLQIRYGNDHNHVEALQKQKWREEEEHDQLSSHYRDGVYKALAEKRKVEEKLRNDQKGAPRQPHRVSTSKSNSLAGLSSRHASSRDTFSPPPESSKKKKEAPPPVEKKKRPPPPAVDFRSLMKAAEDISQGKKVDLNAVSSSSGASAPKKMREEPSSSRSGQSMIGSSKSFNKASMMREEYNRQKALAKVPERGESSTPSVARPHQKTSVTSSMGLTRNSSSSSKSQQKSSEKDDSKAKDKKEVKGRFQKGPTPPPLIPAAVPGKKYLPGDVRYQAQQASSGTSRSREERPPHSSSSGASSSRSDKDRDRDRQRSLSTSARSQNDRSREKERELDRPQSSKDSDRRRLEKEREMERVRRKRERDDRDMQSIEKIRRQERLKAEQRMSLVERDRMRDRERRRQQYSDEDVDDEEYDSEMDDFIDDSGMDMDEISRMEFEETLKCVNPKYNKKRWRERERQIDDRSMVADYRTISREEARSAKLGFMEDFIEAKKGKSEAL